MIAGGASLAPRRCSLPMLATAARSSPVMLVHGLEHGRAEEQEADVLVPGCRPGSSRLSPVSVRHRPVVVLARAVDAGERLLVQQAAEPVARRPTAAPASPSGYGPTRDVRLLEHRRHLELARRDFVVARLRSARRACTARAPPPRCTPGCAPGSSRSSGPRAAGPGGCGADERAAGHHEVGAQRRSTAVDEEVLLLGPERGEDALDALVAEQLEQLDRLVGERVHRAQQRRLLVERLAGP